METFSFVLIFVAYVGIRLLLGHHKDKTYKDKKKYQKGISLVSNGENQKAIEYFSEIIKNDKRSGVAWAYRGEANFNLGNLYKALADCTKAVNLDNSLRQCYLIRGKALYELGNFENALVDFNKAIWYYKSHSGEIFRLRGLCHQQLEKYEAASKDYREAIYLGDEEANYFLMKIENVKKLD